MARWEEHTVTGTVTIVVRPVGEAVAFDAMTAALANAYVEVEEALKDAAARVHNSDDVIHFCEWDVCPAPSCTKYRAALKALEEVKGD